VLAAAAQGSEFVVLPEKWNLLGGGADLRAGAESLEGASISAARRWAAELGITLVAGSFAERGEGERAFNTSVLIDADGEIAAVYRKIHMFDVDVGGVSYRESDNEEPGEDIVLGEGPGLELGLTVCYDLRFPELYRILAVRGARAFTVPSAFTSHTGRDHWELLLRARAVENQAFVIAADQFGKAPPNYDSYGRSMIVDPWGVVLAAVADGEGVASCDLDLEAQDRIRRSLPSLANRRPHAYRWPELEEALSDG
jgi:predicted amidohydrolase